MPCNVLAVTWPLTGRTWANVSDFLLKLNTDHLTDADMKDAQSTCDYMIIVDRDPDPTVLRYTEAQIADNFRGLGPGVHLFFLKPKDQYFANRHMMDSAPITTVDDFGALIAGSTYVGQSVTSAPAPADSPTPGPVISPDIVHQLQPLVGPSLQPGVMPIHPNP
jgi:hypothetical protein